MTSILDDQAAEVIAEMSKSLSQVKVDFHLRERADGPFLFIDVATPNERFFRALREAQSTLGSDHPFFDRATVAKRPKTQTNRLELPETQLLRSTLSASLTVDRHTFSEDFFERYIRSVFGYEDQIVSSANFLVFGRRGSGKSSLLAFAMHTCEKQGKPFAWVDMQTYATRGDVQVSIFVLSEVLQQLSVNGPSGALDAARGLLDTLSETADDQVALRSLTRALPRIRQALADVVSRRGDVSIFLDDIHVVNQLYQPVLLNTLYAVCRGNRCHLKISGIEQFSRPWDSSSSTGLQVPHDATVLKLDYNLTMPDKSRAHIVSILDAHARFCGLPEVAYIVGKGVLSRLVWVAAAVPRDALNLFSQAITKANAQSQVRVSITSVNAAASDMAEQKLRDMEQDVRNEDAHLKLALEQVKSFCMRTKKKNAFLLEIRNDDENFKAIQELIALRFVHVLHEGITPHEAGRRYQALMLDYGFYVGIRAAKSVDLFQKEPTTPSVQRLRKLPIYSVDANEEAPGDQHE